MAMRRVGPVDQQRFQPADAEMEGHRRQAAHAAGNDGERQHPLRFIGQAAQHPCPKSAVQTSETLPVTQL
jgi:hypothetical protein